MPTDFDGGMPYISMRTTIKTQSLFALSMAGKREKTAMSQRSAFSVTLIGFPPEL
jgi:hypothetical protein